MLPTTTHPFVSAKADGPDATLVRPSNWNASHTHIGFPRSYLAGLGLSNNSTDPTNDIDIAVGECQDSTNARDLILASALTKRLDAAWAVGTNQGGLDTGSIANDTYHVHLIKRSDTGVVDALFSLSATAPTMPTNYDFRRRIGSIIRSGGVIVTFAQNGDEFLRKVPVSDYNSNNPGTAAVTRTLSVPTGIQVLAIHSPITERNAIAVSHVLITALDQDDTVPTATVNTYSSGRSSADANEMHFGSVMQVRTNTSAQIRTRHSDSDAGTYIRGTTHGWIDRRGRDD